MTHMENHLENAPHVVCLLITYKRTELAVRTVQGIENNLRWPNFSWHIADDGSSPEHRQAIEQAIGSRHYTTWSNAERGGVGRSMNFGQRESFKRADFVLWLEDDWELCQPLDLRPCVELLRDDVSLGMVRLGYISPGIKGGLISGAGRLWWKLDKGPTYTFTGHASLRHKRFYQVYGDYPEGLAPGATELHYCGRFNGTEGPAVVVPAWTGEWGVFGHIGGDSLKDVEPGS